MNAIIKHVAAMTLLGVAALAHSHEAAAATAPEKCQTLYAGKTTNAGEVCVTNDETKLYVTYKTTGDWYLDDAHLFVGATLSTMPVTKTLNPKIGNFPYVVEDLNSQSYTFSLPLGDAGVSNPCSPNTVAVAAHAALVRKDAAGAIYQTETGWASGTQLNVKGSWATTFTYTTQCPPVPQTATTLACETAFAFGDQTFDDLGILKNRRWGWQITVNPGVPGSTPIYAGAGQNDITKGSHVGYLDYYYDGATLALSYNMLNSWVLQATHVYAADSSTTTTAPGQYGNLHEGLKNVTFDSYQIGVSGNPIFVIAHAEACHAVSN